MRKRIMIIGTEGCGKTTLANRLLAAEIPIKRTQDIIYKDRVIDVPGIFVQSPYMRGHLITLAQNHASCVLMLLPLSAAEDSYPPGFAKVFNCPVIGVVTKSDLLRSDLLTEKKLECFSRLKRAGVEEPYYCISIFMESQLAELKERLDCMGEA